MKIWLISSGIILILLALLSPALAGSGNIPSTTEENTGTNQVPEKTTITDLPSDTDYLDDVMSEGDPEWVKVNYWNMIVALVVVIILIWAVGYLIRIIYTRLPGYQGRDDFTVLNSLRISTHASLFIVRFIDEIYVLAATPQNVSIVDHITDPEIVQDIINTMGRSHGAANPHAFGTLLKKRLSERIEADAVQDKQRVRTEEQQHFRDAMDRLSKHDNEEEKDENRGEGWLA